MIIHYFKLFLRGIRKNPGFTAINVTGLCVGITCCLLIAIYVKHELSYDNFQQKGDRITRLIMEYSFNGSAQRGNYTSTKVGPSFKRNFPEVESFVRMYRQKRIVKSGDKLFNEKKFMFADSTFFGLFSFRLLQGNPAKALSGPNAVVLTKESAEKYFGSENPIGKIINVGSEETAYMVTGVIENCPYNSHIQFDFLASFSSLGVTQEQTYWEANYTTYLLLKNPEAIASLQSKIAPFMKKEMAGELGGTDYLSFIAEPFLRIHLYSEHGGFEANGSITYIYIISFVALLILAIACFTFINLSIAKSVERAKEIGIRKVAGAFKNQIFWQFIGESVFLCTCSLLLSILFASLLLPGFSHLTERRLDFSALSALQVSGFACFIILVISFLAGFYPALVLSGFQPVKVLKGSFKTGSSGLWLRKTLFVFQFVISAFLIVSTFIIQKQLHYIHNKDLGFNRDHVLILPFDNKVKQVFPALKTELKQHAGVRFVSKANCEPINIMGGYVMQLPGMPKDQLIPVCGNPVDEDYIAASGIRLIAGENFSRRDMGEIGDENATNNKYHFILNRSAAKELGFSPSEAIGKKMSLGEGRQGIIKGVTEDFHFTSLHDPIKPLVLFPDLWASLVMVKVSGNNLPATVSHIEKTWKTLVSHRPFEYRFMDDDYNAIYESEMRLGNVMNLFTTVAVLLACLGLFGLSSYSIQQRTREVGILKVLGASISAIVARLSGSFLKLVIIAVLISFPLAWWAMSTWLQDFAYRTQVNAWTFIITGGLSFAVAFVTISFKAVKAASANPVKSLRTE